MRSSQFAFNELEAWMIVGVLEGIENILGQSALSHCGCSNRDCVLNGLKALYKVDSEGIENHME